MGTAKKCYRCATETDADAKTCPRCGVNLGARTGSGIAAKPGSPLLLVLLVLIGLGAAGKAALHYQAPPASAPLIESGEDAAIRIIKAKGAGELKAVGVADIGYKDDALCVYVDQKFSGLSRTQREELLALVAVEWEKNSGRASTAVKVLEYGTKKLLEEQKF